MRKGINLPVIEELSIRGYSLYPGGDGSEGINLSFANGVTVIAGINGIGKTTLLTLLSRMLLGPTDPQKAMRNIGRVSQRELIDLTKFNFFTLRVPEVLGDDSTATLKFKLGDEEIIVTRFMRNMRLKNVTISGVPYVPTTEIAMIEDLARKAGLLSGYDFHVVIRNLQFFNEERPPLLWDPGSQFELYKILFFDEKTASTLNSIFAKIQSYDSDYRNRIHQLNKRRDSLPTVIRKPSSTIEVEALNNMLTAAKLSYEKANTDFLDKRCQLETLEVQMKGLDMQAEDAQIELAESEQQLTQQDAMYILQALPTLNEKEKLLMQGLATGCGCFICGSTARNHLGVIREKTSSGHCFVCDAPVNITNTKKATPITVQQVRKTEGRINDLQAEIIDIDEHRKTVEKQIRDIIPALRKATNDRMSALRELESLYAQRPESSGEPSSVQNEIEREEQELKLLGAEIKELTSNYRKSVADAEVRMEEIKEDLRTRLDNYATAFLQEQVSVTFNNETPFSLATGAERVHIPSFTIKMTSSTHRVAHERRTSDSVSESQKEFLDLAFRMSLLDIVSNKGSTMLVIETPEASLDSWFMLRAAELMRSFAPEDVGQGRKLIATSNINGTVMIPALLGLIDNDGKMMKLPTERKKHLVNLLKLTPPSATLQEDKAHDLLREELGRYLDVR
ncbi:AAA family ATPase [Serratia sp. CY85251]|uniref:AAA family ATPase n=1 Tax=Serratia sp. CY85251 TaxID=3383696 RepID=UPI003FA16CD0